MPDGSQNPITEDEFNQSLRGFYDLTERIAQALEWRNAALWHESQGAKLADPPPHLPAGTEAPKPPMKTSREW